MGNFCYQTAHIWVIVGWAISILKIVVPILIIIFGIIELSKVIISNDDKAIKIRTVSLIKRLAVGVIIFFVPTIINFAFSLISGFSKATEEVDYMKCVTCITKPYRCNTTYKGVFDL